MLAARTGGPVGVHLQIILVDLDLLRVLHHRRNLHAGEARLAAMGGVERRQAHQPVYAALGPEQPIGVLARGTEGRRLDARFLSRARLKQLHLEAPALRPAHLHPQDHLGPVLSIGAPRARIDAYERIARVIAPGEQPLLLEDRQARLDRCDLLVDLSRSATRPRLAICARPSRSSTSASSAVNVSRRLDARACSAETSAARPSRPRSPRRPSPPRAPPRARPATPGQR